MPMVDNSNSLLIYKDGQLLEVLQEPPFSDSVNQLSFVVGPQERLSVNRSL